jgi:hypothetical protein
MGVNDPQLQSKGAVATQNFFIPLRSTEMEADHGDNMDHSTEGQHEKVPSSQAGRPPPIVLTSRVNLVQLQRQLKVLLKGNFEFHSTRNRTRVVMKEMADLSTIHSHFESNNLPYFHFLSQIPEAYKSCDMTPSIHHFCRRHLRWVGEPWL